MLPPLIDVFGRSHHEYSILNSGVKDARVTNLGSIGSALLGSLLKQSAHACVGELRKGHRVGRAPQTWREGIPMLEPGRRVWIADNETGTTQDPHVRPGRVTRVIENPKPHAEVAYLKEGIEVTGLHDLARVRDGGHLLVNHPPISAICKTHDGRHIELKAAALTTAGLALLELPTLEGEFAWLMGPSPQPLLRGTGIQGYTNRPLFYTPWEHLAIEAFVVSEAWTYRDPSGWQIVVSPVQTTQNYPGNADKDLLDRRRPRTRPRY